MSKVSVILPSRNESLLSKTIDDVFAKARGSIEVIAVLDAYWPDPPLQDRENLIIIHRGEPHGMRAAINSAARVASGDYLLKTDAHCMFGDGFDEILKADSEENWLSVPSKYTLEAEKWERGRGPVDYWYLTFPYVLDPKYGWGFHGKKWCGPGGLNGDFWYREKERKDILIDDIIAFQGSCWFMPKDLFFKIGTLENEQFNLHQEAQELCFKVWLSGGRVIVNKKTWYAHLHKGAGGRGFHLLKQDKYDAEDYSVDFWMNNKWSGQTRNMKWLMDKFLPLDGWPMDWNDQKYKENFRKEGIAA